MFKLSTQKGLTNYGDSYLNSIFHEQKKCDCLLQPDRKNYHDSNNTKTFKYSSNFVYINIFKYEYIHLFEHWKYMVFCFLRDQEKFL